MTTYCLSFQVYVMGVACAAAGNSYDHDSLPVSESNARRWGSIAAAVNTNPPAVIIGPPRLTEPVCLPANIVPSGTAHTIFPLNKSTASVVPHGGALHGNTSAVINGLRNIP